MNELGLVSLLLIFLLCASMIHSIVIQRFKKQNSTYFIAFCSLATLWSIFHYMTTVETFSYEMLFFSLKLSLSFAVAFSFFTLLVVRSVVRKERVSIFELKPYGAFSIVAISLMLSNLAFTGIDVSVAPPTPNAGALFPVVPLVLLVNSAASLGSLTKNVKSQPVQTRRLLSSLLLMVILFIVTITIPAVAFGNTTFVPFAPLYTIPVLLAAWHSIYFHNLYQVRDGSLRSLARSLLGVLTWAAYYALIFMILQLLFDVMQSTKVNLSVIVLLSVIISLSSFPWIRGLIGLIMNRLMPGFSVDFSERRRIFGSEIRTKRTLNTSIQLLENEIRDMLNPSGFKIEIFASNGKQLLVKTTRGFKDLDVSKRHLSEEITALFGDNNLKNTRLNEAEYLISIGSASGSPLGYILLGPSQIGAAYSPAQIDFLLSIARSSADTIRSCRELKEATDFSSRLQSEVKTATNDLRRQIEIKNELISMTTHQLKPQLTAAKGFIELSAAGTSSEKKELRELSAQAIDRSSSVLNDMLSVADLEPEMSIDTTKFDLMTLVSNEIDSIQKMHGENTSRISLKTAPKEIEIKADKLKVREAIFNLIDNALKYSEPKDSIKVEVHEDKEFIEFKVTDNGPGIAKAELTKVFDKFFRAKSSSKSKQPGTGLGLFMVKRVIEAHGGEVFANSKVGHGSEFGFRLET